MSYKPNLYVNDLFYFFFGETAINLGSSNEGDQARATPQQLLSLYKYGPWSTTKAHLQLSELVLVQGLKQLNTQLQLSSS